MSVPCRHVLNVDEGSNVTYLSDADQKSSQDHVLDALTGQRRDAQRRHRRQGLRRREQILDTSTRKPPETPMNHLNCGVD